MAGDKLSQFTVTTEGRAMPSESDPSAKELERVAEQTAARLHALGVTLSGTERPEELARIEEAIERFEEAVEARGGDLMVDEGPPGSGSEPDDPHFALPLRERTESVAGYLERIERATDLVRTHPPIG